MKKNIQQIFYHKYCRIVSSVFITILVITQAACSYVKTNADFNITESPVSGITIFNANRDYVVNYIPKEKILLDEITGNGGYEKAVVISKSGKEEVFSAKMYLNVDGSVSIEGDKTIKDVKGIYLADDFYSITDAYYDAKKYLESNEKVMVVLLDGFSLNQFKAADEKGCVDFLSQYFQHEALSVVTPVTNAGYAAIITGKTPDVNGVHDRSMREMNVESIFDYTIKNNKKSILLEGDIKILNTEIEPTLHTDEDKDGDTDDEMFESALKAAQEDYDFVFIHFHGIDDRGHAYGPMSDETMEYIKLVDNYMEKISDVWKGTIILTPDHGMHETEEGGDHGECRSSDMVVPYFIKH